MLEGNIGSIVIYAVIGIISIILSQCETFFKINGYKSNEINEIKKLEFFFTTFAVENLYLKDSPISPSYINDIRANYNWLIKSVGRLEELLNEHDKMIILFKKTTLVTGMLFLMACVSGIVIVYLQLPFLTFLIFLSLIIGSVMLYQIVINVKRLSNISRIYKDTKKTLLIQHSNMVLYGMSKKKSVG